MLKLERLSFDVKEEKGTKKILSNINLTVDDGKFVAGEVYEHFITGFMLKMHDGTAAGYILLNQNIEAGASVAIRMGRKVLAMQCLAGNTFLLKPLAILG